MRIVFSLVGAGIFFFAMGGVAYGVDTGDGDFMYYAVMAAFSYLGFIILQATTNTHHLNNRTYTDEAAALSAAKIMNREG